MDGRQMVVLRLMGGGLSTPEEIAQFSDSLVGPGQTPATPLDQVAVRALLEELVQSGYADRISGSGGTCYDLTTLGWSVVEEE